MGFEWSPIREVSLPKFTGVIFGLLIWRGITFWATSAQRIAYVTAAYALAVVACTCVGVLGADLSNKGWAGWVWLGESIPHLSLRLPGIDGSVNANAVGGTSLFVLPLLVSVLWSRASNLRNDLRGHGGQGARSRSRQHLLTLGLVVAMALVVAALVASQSRSAWISMAATIGLGAAIEWRRIRYGVGVVAIVALSMAWTPPVSDLLWTDSRAATRMEIWHRAVLCIRDSPFTGVGLNAFRRVGLERYPVESTGAIGRAQRFQLSRHPGDVLTPIKDLVHAHNMFLQTALDIGVIGLSVYLAILLVTTAMSRKVYAQGDGANKSLVLGLWSSLVAMHLFGLTDAIALGAKMGVFLWWNIGLIGALYCNRLGSHSVPDNE